jgi:hypothetical protein
MRESDIRKAKLCLIREPLLPGEDYCTDLVWDLGGLMRRVGALVAAVPRRKLSVNKNGRFILESRGIVLPLKERTSPEKPGQLWTCGS